MTLPPLPPLCQRWSPATGTSVAGLNQRHLHRRPRALGRDCPGTVRRWSRGPWVSIAGCASGGALRG